MTSNSTAGRCLAAASVFAALLGGCAAEAVKAPSKVELDPSSAEGLALIDRLARTDHVGLLQRCLDHYNRSYTNYTCLFTKQERLDGTLRPPQTVKVRFRDEPFSVAFEWVENPDGGDRMLFIEGRHEGKMLIRPAFALLRGMTVTKDPWGPDVQQRSLRPITKFGFKRNLQELIEVYQLAAGRGDLKTSFDGYAEIDGRKTAVLVRDLPARPEYPAPRTVIYIDLESLVPTGIRSFDTEGKLTANYVYRDVRFNQPLTDADFTPASLDMANP